MRARGQRAAPAQTLLDTEYQRRELMYRVARVFIPAIMAQHSREGRDACGERIEVLSMYTALDEKRLLVHSLLLGETGVEVRL